MTTETTLTTAKTGGLSGENLGTPVSISTDIVSFLLILLRNLWVVVLMGILGAAGAFVVVRSQTPIYESYVSVIISPRIDLDLGNTLQSINVLNQNVVGTYVQILRSNSARNEAMDNLNPRYTLEMLQLAEVDVRPVENSTVMIVTVRSENAELARDLSDAIAEEVVRNNPIPSLIQAYPLKVLDSAVLPEEPIAPQDTLNLLLGTVGGLAVGVGLAFFLEDYRKARNKAVR